MIRVLTILTFSLLLASVINAQEIGIFPVKIWTNTYEIQNPYGFGLIIGKDIWKLNFRFEYIHAENERSYNGYMTYGFLIAPSPYSLEHISSKSALNSYEILVSITEFLKYDNFSLNFGFGLTFDKYKAERKGSTSGKTIEFMDNSKSGTLISLSVCRKNIIWLPLEAEISYKLKTLAESIYATDVELPFSNIRTVQELHLSIIFVIS
jgi:hypothetical protein